VDAVDNLTGADEAEAQHEADLETAEEDAKQVGRQSMKDEILADVNRWLENQPNYDLIAAPCEALIKEIEEVEV
jgi:hypothetical protein